MTGPCYLTQVQSSGHHTPYPRKPGVHASSYDEHMEYSPSLCRPMSFEDSLGPIVDQLIQWLVVEALASEGSAVMH
jgi:hypothetical protein